jgi:hypothetical protein
MLSTGPVGYWVLSLDATLRGGGTHSSTRDPQFGVCEASVDVPGLGWGRFSNFCPLPTTQLKAANVLSKGIAHENVGRSSASSNRSYQPAALYRPGLRQPSIGVMGATINQLFPFSQERGSPSTIQSRERSSQSPTFQRTLLSSLAGGAPLLVSRF